MLSKAYVENTEGRNINQRQPVNTLNSLLKILIFLLRYNIKSHKL